MDLPCRKYTGAASNDPHQIPDAVVVESEEGIENGRHQDAAARMRLVLLLEHSRIWPRSLPDSLLVRSSQIVTQRAALANSLPELLGQLAQQVVRFQVSPCVRDLMAKHLGIREMLEQRHHVGERLMKGPDVLVARFIEIGVHAIDERVGGLVSDDVVRETGKDGAAGKMATTLVAAGEIAEDERSLRRTVVGVGFAQCVRVDTQALHVAGLEGIIEPPSPVGAAGRLL